jgi:hypothetical protein
MCKLVKRSVHLENTSVIVAEETVGNRLVQIEIIVCFYLLLQNP